MSKAVYYKEIDPATAFAEIKGKKTTVDSRSVYRFKGGPLVVQTAPVAFERAEKGYLYVRVPADVRAWVESLEQASQGAFDNFTGEDVKFVQQLSDGDVLKLQNTADYCEEKDCGFDDLKADDPLVCIVRVEGLTTRSVYKGLIFYCDRVRSPKRKANWLPVEVDDEPDL